MAQDAQPTVSVVIPTTGRTELGRAVSSVEQQRGVSSEIIIIADLARENASPTLRDYEQRHRVLYTGGKRGGGFARNQGIANATAPWVAMLDDDDYWTSDKLAVQLESASLSGATFLSSRVNQFAAESGRELARSVPIRLLERAQDPAEYLFRNRRAGTGRASLFTSTLMVKTSLATAVPWDESLKRHQDWDWLIRLSDHPDYQAHHCPDALVNIQVGSPSSISAQSDWEASLTWASNILGPRDPRVFVDFVMAQSLRYALQARSAAGAATAIGFVLRARRLPAASCVMVGAAGILGRRGIERAMELRR